ncbi:MAG TPA: PIG-L deacetylase family protein [Kiloniellaceae bacterium]|nr:PIG-L deacetylase family protein [Kiloniellaceae bacterium]
MSAEDLLVIAPHPDDETLGAGGTVARAAAAGMTVTVVTVAAHMPPLYSEAVHAQTLAESRKAQAILGAAEPRYLDIPALSLGEMPVAQLNGAIAEAVGDLRPSVVLCPYPDRHIDHRLIFDAVMVATRPVGAGSAIELLAAYETLSETHWNAPHIEPNFIPSWVVDITATLETKLEALACYESQIPPFPGPRSLEAARALAAFRGTQAGFAYGEGFHIIRMTAAPEALVAKASSA